MQAELQNSTLCMKKCIHFKRDGLLLPSIVRYLQVLRLGPRVKVLDLNLLLLERMEVNWLFGSNLKHLCLLTTIKKKIMIKRRQTGNTGKQEGQQPTTLV